MPTDRRRMEIPSDPHVRIAELEAVLQRTRAAADAATRRAELLERVAEDAFRRAAVSRSWMRSREREE